MAASIGLGVSVSGAASAAAALGRVGSAAMTSGQRWRAMGDLARTGGLAVAAGAAAAAAGIKAAVDVEQEFSRSMRLVQANSGATAAQMRKLEQAATTMGPKLGFGARESADAMLELAKAGLDAGQVINGGLKGTLILAAAGATDLGTASTIASNAMNSFGLKSSQMTEIAGILAGGANASTASVESLGMALSQVGPGARSAGLSLNETVAALSAFDNAGIKGSDAGTSLKTMLARLVPSNDKAAAGLEALGVNALDAQGKFRSLEEISGQLKKGMVGLSDAERSRALQAAFGSDSTRAAIVLSREGAAGIRKYIKATEDQTAAQRAVKAQTSGTSGALKRLSSEAEVAKLKLGQALAPSVVKVANALSSRMVPATQDAVRTAREWKQELDDNGIDGVVQKIEQLTDKQGKLTPILDETRLAGESLWRIVKELAPAFVDAATALPPFLQPLQMTGDVLKLVADALEAIPDPLKSMGVQAGIAALILPRLAAGVGFATGAFTRGTVAASGYYQAVRYGSQYSQQAALAASRLGSAARTAAGIGGILALTKGMQGARTETTALVTMLGAAALGASVGGPLGAVVGAGAGAAMYFYSEKTRAAKKATEEAAVAAAQAKQDYQNLRGSLDELSGATTRSTRAFVQDKLERSGVLDAFAKEGVARRTVVNAIFGERDAQKEVHGFIRQQKAAYADLDVQIERLGQTQERGSAIGRAKYVEARHGLEDQQAAIRKVIDTYRSEGMELRRGVADQRARGRVLQDYTALAGKVPRRIISKLEATGIQPTVAGIARVVRQYKIADGKKIKALIGVTGVDTSVGEVRKVVKALDSADKKKVELREFRSSLRRGIGDFRQLADRGGRDISESLQKSPRKAKLSMPGVAPSVRSGIEPAKSAASSGGRAVGSNIKYGFMGGFAGAAGEWSAATRGATRAAVNAARDEADIHSPSRKMHKIGKQMVQGASLAFQEGRSELSGAGRNLIRDLVRGIGSEKANVARVLEAVSSEVERTTNRVKRLQQLRASYVSDFRGFSSSIFTAQAPTGADGAQGPQTVGNMLTFAAAEAEKAKRVRAAVKRLTGKGGLGLSADLIKQLRAQGAGGIDQILALSTASRQDVRRFNQYNKATNGAYTATGLGLFQQQGGNTRLMAAQRDQRMAETLAHEVHKALRGLKIDGGQFRLEGTTLIATIKATERKNGKS